MTRRVLNGLVVKKIIKKDALGEADIIIAATMGALLGFPSVLMAIYASALFAIIPALFARNHMIPFVPFLALGTLVVYFFNDRFLINFTNDEIKKSEKLKIDINKTKLILVTHEHTDHISGVFLTAKKLKIPVFTSFGTAQKLKEKDKYGINIQFIDKNKKYTEFGFSFVAFPVFHDAVDPVGFALQLKNKEE